MQTLSEIFRIGAFSVLFLVLVYFGTKLATFAFYRAKALAQQNGNKKDTTHER